MSYTGMQPEMSVLEVETFVTDGTQDTFSLKYASGGASAVDVYVNGQWQQPNEAYGVVGNTLAFDEAPPTGTLVVRYRAIEGIVQSPAYVAQNATEFRQSLGLTTPEVKTEMLAEGLFSKENILGEVSEIAGAPTGAIFEYGQNTNGRYIKYADGTIIMWTTERLPSDAIAAGDYQPPSGNQGIVWEKPASLVSGTEYASAEAGQPGTTVAFAQIVACRNSVNNNPNAWRLLFLRSIVAGWTRRIRFYCIGRWY